MAQKPQGDNPAFKMIDQIREQINKDLYAGKLNYDSAIPMLKRNIEVAEKAENIQLAALLYKTWGTIETERGNFEDALTYKQQSIEYFKQINDRRNVGIGLNNVGEVYRRSGQHQEASNYYQQARAIAREVSYYTLVITTYNNEGQNALAMDNVDAAIELLNLGLQTQTDSGQWDIDTIQRVLPEIQSSLAEAQARKGNFAEAWTNVNRALDVAKEFDQVIQIANAYRTMALVSMLEDEENSETILGYFDQSQQHWQLVNNKVDLGRMFKLKGDYLRKIDSGQEAISAYETALEYLERANLTDEAQLIRELI